MSSSVACGSGADAFFVSWCTLVCLPAVVVEGPKPRSVPPSAPCVSGEAKVQQRAAAQLPGAAGISHGTSARHSGHGCCEMCPAACPTLRPESDVALTGCLAADCSVDLPDGRARGYVLEVFAGHFQLPDLGPIGACSARRASGLSVLFGCCCTARLLATSSRLARAGLPRITAPPPGLQVATAHSQPPFCSPSVFTTSFATLLCVPHTHRSQRAGQPPRLPVPHRLV